MILNRDFLHYAIILMAMLIACTGCRAPELKERVSLEPSISLEGLWIQGDSPESEQQELEGLRLIWVLPGTEAGARNTGNSSDTGNASNASNASNENVVDSRHSTAVSRTNTPGTANQTRGWQRDRAHFRFFSMKSVHNDLPLSGKRLLRYEREGVIQTANNQALFVQRKYSMYVSENSAKDQTELWPPDAYGPFRVDRVRRKTRSWGLLESSDDGTLLKSTTFWSDLEDLSLMAKATARLPEKTRAKLQAKIKEMGLKYTPQAPGAHNLALVDRCQGNRCRFYYLPGIVLKAEDQLVLHPSYTQGISGDHGEAPSLITAKVLEAVEGEGILQFPDSRAHGKEAVFTAKDWSSRTPFAMLVFPLPAKR